jgi:hypothetical protein
MDFLLIYEFIGKCWCILKDASYQSEWFYWKMFEYDRISYQHRVFCTNGWMFLWVHGFV